ncbi:hypothetical protein, partial [Nocardia abscessus]|uniref:hypothetical protein n=1 Tax=Nocardia abscessus TaxID=120957 RepID=UPI00245901EF
VVPYFAFPVPIRGGGSAPHRWRLPLFVLVFGAGAPAVPPAALVGALCAARPRENASPLFGLE